MICRLSVEKVIIYNRNEKYSDRRMLFARFIIPAKVLPHEMEFPFLLFAALSVFAIEIDFADNSLSTRARGINFYSLLKINRSVSKSASLTNK